MTDDHDPDGWTMMKPVRPSEKETKPKGKRRHPRPANLEFTKDEMARLNRLAAVDRCAEKRITWNPDFAAWAMKQIGAGRRPSEVFRMAGVGPEVIGSKRIERCCARWRQRGEGENEGEIG